MIVACKVNSVTCGIPNPEQLQAILSLPHTSAKAQLLSEYMAAISAADLSESGLGLDSGLASVWDFLHA